MKNKYFIGLVLVLGMIISSVILSFGMSKIFHVERTVSVRGLDEREVDADLAIWQVSFSIPGNSLPDLQKEIVASTEKVKNFLETYGLTSSDYSVLAPAITDTTVNIYMDATRRQYDYIAKQTILVRTGNIESVKKAHSNTIDLMSEGIAISSDYDSRVEYVFNGLNDIKPEMIKKATENARTAAEQFAENSGSKVGNINSANQGLFSIEDAAPGMEEKKIVRVVTTVVYSLVD